MVDRNLSKKSVEELRNFTNFFEFEPMDTIQTNICVNINTTRYFVEKRISWYESSQHQSRHIVRHYKVFVECVIMVLDDVLIMNNSKHIFVDMMNNFPW
ncbi:hypothetical protein NY2A_b007R [Paramecium bursaria Chlorella virus NY2A]|uniref:Uncharacterized protein b007R n=1 Tax=Paramecium bursaria Chlorella virus NY2A TaxID=46021 RepID=A7IVN2_PBCVN|nr:hypothetical protein NY2A_b007R [Paramecium bursaria Chlorella virus NY2A]ABT14406.1 hypothetical protein NY2A_b007R [Paramecium bursaria Chlorella virus NY2A]